MKNCVKNKKSCSDSDSDCDKNKKCCALYLTKTRYPTNLTGIEVGSKVLLVVGKKLSYCQYNTIICVGTYNECTPDRQNGGFKGIVNKYYCKTGKMLGSVMEYCVWYEFKINNIWWARW